MASLPFFLSPTTSGISKKHFYGNWEFKVVIQMTILTINYWL